MGRYGQKHSRKSGRSRYAPTEEIQPVRRAKSHGVGMIVMGLLIFAGIAGGFFLVKIGEQAFDPDSELVSFFKKSLKPAPPDNNAGKSVEKALETVAPSVENPIAIQTYKSEEDVVLPALDSSDEAVRDALAAAAPDMAVYLQTGQLIRKYMQIANDFSQGIRLAKHFSFLKLAEPFSVEAYVGKEVIASQSYRRYDSLAHAVDTLKEQELVAVYKKFRPLMLQVFAEFSYPDGHNLDDIFIGAAKQILSAPVINGPIAVTKQTVLYKFADPNLETLNPVHKQLLRMGPENTRLIQNKVRALMGELVNPKPEDALPEPNQG